MNTGNSAEILAPDQIHELLVQPVMEQAVATQVATVISTASRTWRIPVVTADPSAAWVAEGAEIPLSDAALDEVEVVPAKLAGLTIITAELAADTSPEAQEVVGQGLARDCARKLDAAFFGALTAPAPPGLGSTTPTVVAAGAAFTNMDPFAEGMSYAEEVGATLGAWVASPATALDLARIKVDAGSNLPLIASPEAGTSARRSVGGLPLFVSPAVADGKVWGIPRDRTFVVIRQDTKIDVDGSVFFTSDRVAVRATMRVGFGFAHQQALIRIDVTP